MKTVYLAGGITGLSYDEATAWREKVRIQLTFNSIKALSPMRGKAYLSAEDKLADSYSDKTMSSIDGINVRDFNDCKTADAILVNFLGSKKVSIGTVMEVAWGRAFRKPTVIVMEKDNVHRHSMVEYGAIIVDDLEEGVRAIVQLIG
jgi:hypothetical protein